MECPPPPSETCTIHYQLPRDILLQIWWRRVLFNRSRARFYVLLFVAVGLIVYAAPHPIGVSFALFTCLYLALTPFIVRHRLAKAIDETPQFTDPKTVEFGPSHFIVSGPNWRSELPWTTYRAFSEDESYFFLSGTDIRLPAVVPKSAFTPHQMEKFRAYATSQI
jgi:YcxB-like protein